MPSINKHCHCWRIQGTLYQWVAQGAEEAHLCKATFLVQIIYISLSKQKRYRLHPMTENFLNEPGRKSDSRRECDLDRQVRVRCTDEFEQLFSKAVECCAEDEGFNHEDYASAGIEHVYQRALSHMAKRVVTSCILDMFIPQ